MLRRPVGVGGEGRLGGHLAGAVGERGEEESEKSEEDVGYHDSAADEVCKDGGSHGQVEESECE